MPWTLARYCTSFVHVPHYGVSAINDDDEDKEDDDTSTGTGQQEEHFMIALEASLSIVLFEYSSMWSQRNDRDEDVTKFQKDGITIHEGQKYHVQHAKRKGDVSPTQRKRIQDERKRQREQQQLEEVEEEKQKSQRYPA